MGADFGQHLKEVFAADEAKRTETAKFNATLQAGYQRYS